MALADKIMLLRKQQGWSQIDLADRLDVSRQSVSKWEMAQAVPELDKIVKLSELFNVSTDYLLKNSESDTLPPPPPPPEPEPEPEAEPEEPASEPTPEPVAQEPKKKWLTWPRIIVTGAAAFLVCAILLIIAIQAYSYMSPSGPRNPAYHSPHDIQPSPTPAPQAVTDVYDGPAGASDVADGGSIEAVSSDETYEGPAMETYTYTNGQVAVDGGPIIPADMLAIAKEYEPFGVIYDAEADQWIFMDEPVRVFTDVLISNGQPLEAGTFRGTIRNFAGNGTVDIRTVRDYDHPNDEGFGTLTGIEKFDADPDATWEEAPVHHAEAIPTHHPEH